MIGPDDEFAPRPSAASAIQPAIDWTRWMLFTDGNAGKWFKLGFCAFLATLGQGGFSGNLGNLDFLFPGGQGGGQGGGSGGAPGGQPERPSIEPALDWIRANVELAILIGIVSLLLITVISILSVWLRSRGKFMLLDGIVRNHGAIREPWGRFAHLGNSLTVFRVVLAFGVSSIGLVVAGICAVIAWPDIQAERIGDRAVIAIGLGFTVMAPVALVSLVVALLLEDFIVPVMYRRNLTTLQAFGVFRAEIGSGHFGSILLYYLIKIVLAIVTGMIVIIGVVLTCCMAGCILMIPYLGSVLLLPFAIFFRCYSIFFIEQFGPDWRFFAPHGEI